MMKPSSATRWKLLHWGMIALAVTLLACPIYGIIELFDVFGQLDKLICEAKAIG